MTRRVGKEGLYSRIVPGEAVKDARSRARRRAQLLDDLNGSTHWEACDKSHPKCAELKQLDLADTDEDC